jgi:hypothetical protein
VPPGRPLSSGAGLQGLYLLLVTNKQSNILEDLDTLRMLSKIVPEFAGSPEEDAICRAAFDLIFAFDEVIAQGHKENITVQQVKQNCEMESHEEKLHKMIIQSKINDTKDVMKRKAMEIEKTKMESRKMGGGDKGMGGFIPGGMGGFNAGPSSASSLRPAVDDAAPSFSTPGSANNSTSGARPAAGPKKGMQLGKTKGAASSILETLAKEGEAVDLDPISKPSAVSSSAAAAAAVAADPVYLSVDEKLIVLLNKEGGLENMEVQVRSRGRGAAQPGAGPLAAGAGAGLAGRRAGEAGLWERAAAQAVQQGGELCSEQQAAGCRGRCRPGRARPRCCCVAPSLQPAGAAPPRPPADLSLCPLCSPSPPGHHVAGGQERGGRVRQGGHQQRPQQGLPVQDAPQHRQGGVHGGQRAGPQGPQQAVPHRCGAGAGRGGRRGARQQCCQAGRVQRRRAALLCAGSSVPGSRVAGPRHRGRAARRLLSQQPGGRCRWGAARSRSRRP